MKTTVKALQDYYVEKGGQLADVADITTIPDMIDAITALGGGGSSLPAVTSDDNGDILGVVEGAWAKMDAPTELPSVSAADNGDILGVVEGAWAKIQANQVIIKASLSGIVGASTLTLPTGMTQGDVYNLIKNGDKDVIIYGELSSGILYAFRFTNMVNENNVKKAYFRNIIYNGSALEERDLAFSENETSTTTTMSKH